MRNHSEVSLPRPFLLWVNLSDIIVSHERCANFVQLDSRQVLPRTGGIAHPPLFLVSDVC